MTEAIKKIQVIGLDVGRGYVKGYSQINGMEKRCLFKAVIGEGRDIDLKGRENPIYIECNNKKWFVGMLAEKESHTPVRNSRDSKVTNTVQTLIAAALSEIAVEDNVKIMLGVPYKSFRKSVLEEVIETYKDKTIKVRDKIKGGIKEVNIVNIGIGRESDAALYWQIRDIKSNNKPLGLVSVGFRSTEFTYFDKDLLFIDKNSDTLEFGNKSVMSNVKDILAEKNIIKDLNEIDSSDDYKDYKENAYKIAAENIEQQIEDKWINLGEMEIFIAGGTVLNMKFDEKFKIVDDPQMATAKGLYLLGTLQL